MTTDGHKPDIHWRTSNLAFMHEGHVSKLRAVLDAVNCKGSCYGSEGQEKKDFIVPRNSAGTINPEI